MRCLNLKLYFVILGLLFLGLAEIVKGQSKLDGEFKVTTVFLIRHAERENDGTNDPPLSQAGATRSQKLAQMLEKSNIKGIYTSQFQRSKNTAEPLAKKIGVSINPLTMTLNPANPREVSEESLKAIVDKIYSHNGEGALIVGHTNTVPQIIKLLGGDAVPVIEEQNYDDLFVVVIYEKGKAKVTHLKY